MFFHPLSPHDSSGFIFILVLMKFRIENLYPQTSYSFRKDLKRTDFRQV